MRCCLKAACAIPRSFIVSFGERYCRKSLRDFPGSG
jgi:hypothetical protein